MNVSDEIFELIQNHGFEEVHYAFKEIENCEKFNVKNLTFDSLSENAKEDFLKILKIFKEIKSKRFRVVRYENGNDQIIYNYKCSIDLKPEKKMFYIECYADNIQVKGLIKDWFEEEINHFSDEIIDSECKIIFYSPRKDEFYYTEYIKNEYNENFFKKNNCIEKEIKEILKNFSNEYISFYNKHLKHYYIASDEIDKWNFLFNLIRNCSNIKEFN